MNEQELFDGLKTSHKLVNSPVAFLAELLPSFLSGALAEETFRSSCLRQMRMAKICLSLMAQKDIDANKIIFYNEFILADRINFAVIEEELRGRAFADELWEAVRRYNEANLQATVQSEAEQ